MKFSIFLMLVIINGCSSRPNAPASYGNLKSSKCQAFLSNLKDSLVAEYFSTRSEIEKQTILDKYHQQLQEYLMRNPMDSINVTIDEAITNGLTITTKSHLSNIEFTYGLTFNGRMSPRIDSIYKFMKSLKAGSDTSVNFSFTGTCQVNSPDNAKLPTFRIYAFPVPLQ